MLLVVCSWLTLQPREGSTGSSHLASGRIEVHASDSPWVPVTIMQCHQASTVVTSDKRGDSGPHLSRKLHFAH